VLASQASEGHEWSLAVLMVRVVLLMGVSLTNSRSPMLRHDLRLERGHWRGERLPEQHHLLTECLSLVPSRRGALLECAYVGTNVNTIVSAPSGMRFFSSDGDGAPVAGLSIGCSRIALHALEGVIKAVGGHQVHSVQGQRKGGCQGCAQTRRDHREFSVVELWCC
jgi:hypothetical protein